MFEMKTEVIEKRKDSWLCRVTFNDVEEEKKYTQAEMDEAIKKLKREKAIADVNIAMLEGQKEMFRDELFSRREVK